MDGAFASAGSLVASVLETLGAYYQSFLLDKLAYALSKPVPVLLYVIAVLGVLVRFILRGKLDDLFIWVILGPAVFYFVLNTRTEVQGSIWQFGYSERNQAQAWVEVRTYLGLPVTGTEAGTPPPQPAKVSWVFSIFNNIVSSGIRTITAVLSRANTNVDVLFIANAELAASMRSETVSDTGLRQLIHGPFMRDCRKMMNAADDSLDSTKSRDAQQQSIETFKNSENDPLDPRKSSSVFTYLTTLNAKYPDGVDVALTKTPTEMTKWIEENQDRFLRKTSLNSASPNMAAATSTFPEMITCRAVWNFVSLGLYEFAARRNFEKITDGVTKGVDAEEMMRDLLLIKESNDPSQTPYDAQQERSNLLHATNRVAAMYLLRNELASSSGAAFLSDYTKKGFEIPVLQSQAERDFTFFERIRTQFAEWNEKTGIFAAASTLPYYQGIALYLLSIVFPFFTLLLVIPGRHTGFLMWFFLWIWIKSWDIGFAVVMLLSDVLFKLFTYARDFNEVATNEGWKADLATNLYALKELDPSFQLSTYYSIIGACLTAVPIVSSYLVLGSLKGGASLIARGVDTMSAPILEHTYMFKNTRRAMSERMLAAETELDRGQDNIRSYNAGVLPRTASGSHPGSIDVATQLDPTARSDGNFQGLSGNEATRQAINAAANLGTAAGTAGSVPYATTLGGELPGGFNSAEGKNNVGSVINPRAGKLITQARAQRVVESQRLASYLQMREMDLARETANTSFDTYNQLDVQRRSAISRIAGAFEVPWTTKDGDWGAIFDSRFAHYRQRVDNEVASIDARLVAFPGYDMFMQGPGMRDAFAWTAFYDAAEQNSSLTTDYTSTVVNSPSGPGGTLAGEESSFAVIKTGQSKDVQAVNDGLVLFKGFLNSRGNTVIVRHRNGAFSILSGLNSLDGAYDEGSFILGGTKLGDADTFKFSVAASGINNRFDLLQPSPLLTGNEFAPTERTELPDDLARIFADFDRKIVEKNFEAVPPAR